MIGHHPSAAFSLHCGQEGPLTPGLLSIASSIDSKPNTLSLQVLHLHLTSNVYTTNTAPLQHRHALREN